MKLFQFLMVLVLCSPSVWAQPRDGEQNMHSQRRAELRSALKERRAADLRPMEPVFETDHRERRLSAQERAALRQQLRQQHDAALARP
jgi:hypothetical protein